MLARSSFWRRLPLVASRQAINNLPATSIASKQHTYRNFLFHTSTQEPKTHLTPMTHIPESFGNYDLVKRLKLDFTDVVISKWKSRSTGLTVIHLEYEGIFILFRFYIMKRLIFFRYSTDCQWLFRGCHGK